ncbi:MAG TPA: alginate export family protein [Terriglobia bacterium]
MMFNQRRATAGAKSLARQRLGLLSASLIFSLPLLAADTGMASGQNQQPGAAQDASSQQASSSGSSSSSTQPVAAVSASHYAADGLPASNGAEAGSSPQAAAPAYAPAPDADAGWTPATYINSWLPSWLRLSGEFRNREEAHTGYGFTPGNNYDYNLLRVRLGLDITPTSWFHAFVQARDSQVFGTVPSNLYGAAEDVFDLNQAYVELRDKENGWFSLKTGRQELYFGDERLIARSNWSNATRSFDAVRLTLRSEEYGIIMDTFASSVVKDYPTSFDKVLPGQNFYGVNVGVTKLLPKATVEPYVYLKTLPDVTGADKKPGNERLYTTGLRVSGTIPGGFDYRARYSYQSGHLADNSIRASAYYGILGYTLPSRFEPRFSIEYNYASGNKAIGSSVTGTFDQLYPTIHQWRRLTDLFGEENIKDLKPGFDFRPAKKLRVYLVYSDLSLASRYDSLYSNTGSVLVKVPKGGALSTAIGNELDGWGTYDINRRLQIGAGYGRLFAGQFLKQNSGGADSSYPYAFLDYNF